VVLRGEVRLWDMGSRKVIRTLKWTTKSVNSLVFSPDGKFLATASSDRRVMVWDVATGKKLLDLGGHLGSVNSVAFSPDGKRLASGSADWTVRLWDSERGQEVLTLPIRQAGPRA